MNAEMKRYAALLIRKRDLDGELKELQKEVRELEPRVLNALMEDQITKQLVTVDGVSITLHVHKQLWAKAKRDPDTGDRNKEEVARVLKRCGLSFLVKNDYNTGSLSAYVRERLGDGQALQPTLAAAIDLDEVVSVRGRRSPVSSESKTAKAMRTLRR